MDAFGRSATLSPVLKTCFSAFFLGIFSQFKVISDHLDQLIGGHFLQEVVFRMSFRIPIEGKGEGLVIIGDCETLTGAGVRQC